MIHKYHFYFLEQQNVNLYVTGKISTDKDKLLFMDCQAHYFWGFLLPRLKNLKKRLAICKIYWDDSAFCTISWVNITSLLRYRKSKWIWTHMNSYLPTKSPHDLMINVRVLYSPITSWANILENEQKMYIIQWIGTVEIQL